MIKFNLSRLLNLFFGQLDTNGSHDRFDELLQIFFSFYFFSLVALSFYTIVQKLYSSILSLCVLLLVPFSTIYDSETNFGEEKKTNGKLSRFVFRNWSTTNVHQISNNKPCWLLTDQKNKKWIIYLRCVISTGIDSEYPLV